MNWRRGGRRSAAYGLFGILVLGGCAGGGDKSDVAANTDSSAAPPVREAMTIRSPTVDKLVCVPAIGQPIVRNKPIDSSGDTILVYAQRPKQDPIRVALLTVPKGAVKERTDFTVRVPGGNRVYALVQAEQGGTAFTGPFDPINLDLTLYYNRGCKTTGGGQAADQVADLNGFQVWPAQENNPDPAPMSGVPGTNDHSTSVTLHLAHLSGYILAQGIVSGGDTTKVLPPDSAASPTY